MSTGYADGYGNILQPPGYRQYAQFKPEEILASYARFTQKGCTLAAGQGLITAGTVLARQTSTKQYVRYVSGGSDGAGTAKGVLRDSVDTGVSGGAAPPRTMLGNIVLSGILKNSVLSGLDSGAITALNGRVDDSRDWFVF